MHSQGIIHRDLKIENILIHNNNIIIGDLGLSAQIQITKPNEIRMSHFMSPEVYQQQEHDLNTDIWTLATLFYFILFGSHLFMYSTKYLEKIKQICLPKFDLRSHLKSQNIDFQVPEELQVVFEKTLVIDPKQRINFDQFYKIMNKELLQCMQENVLQEIQLQYQILLRNKGRKRCTIVNTTLFKKNSKIIEKLVQNNIDDNEIFDSKYDVNNSNQFEPVPVSEQPPIKINIQQKQVLYQVIEEKHQDLENTISHVQNKQSSLIEPINDEQPITKPNNFKYQNKSPQILKQTQSQIEDVKFFGPKLNLIQQDINEQQQQQQQMIQNNNNNNIPGNDCGSSVAIQAQKNKQMHKIQTYQTMNSLQSNLQQQNNGIQDKGIPSDLAGSQKIAYYLQGRIQTSEFNTQISQISNGKYDKISQIYQFQINKYSYLADAINFTIPHIKLDSHVYSITNYVICKNMMFFAQTLLRSLEKKSNLFNLQDFDDFINSKCAENFKEKIQQDIQRWRAKTIQFYYSIQLTDQIKNKDIKSFITMRIAETDYNSQMKTHTRKILDLVFKYCYRTGMEHLEDIEKQIQNQNNNNKQKQKVSKFKNQKSEEQLQKLDPKLYKQCKTYLHSALTILLCMLINNIFECQDTHITFSLFYDHYESNRLKEFDFWRFFQWSQHQATPVILRDQIHQVMKCAYGQEGIQHLQAYLKQKHKGKKDQLCI